MISVGLFPSKLPDVKVSKIPNGNDYIYTVTLEDVCIYLNKEQLQHFTKDLLEKVEDL